LKTLIVIGGPTASGKTSLAIQVAQYLNTSILSADSRQCYRELNIGVAKPTTIELASVQHYFINSHSIYDEVSAGIYERYALDTLEQIFTTSDFAVCVGGTGLYLKALCEGIDEMPAINPNIDQEINAMYQLHGLNWVQTALKDSDPEAASQIDMQNHMRIIRALVFYRSTGKSIVSFKQHQKKIRPFNILQFAVDLPRENLYQRINTRVDMMMQEGLLQEVEQLQTAQHLKSMQTVGYTELFNYLNHQISLEQAIDKIKQHSRNYAKRQITWFKHQPDYVWLSTENILKTLMKRFDNTNI
jgi:tRNA dimethylallyltransferase